jgi:hypothetical protein
MQARLRCGWPLLSAWLVERLSSLARPGAQLDKVRSLFGNGIATSSGAYHLRQRRMIEAAFRHHMLESYVDIMHRVVGERLATWQDGQTVAMAGELHAISFIVVAKALFTTDVGVDLVDEVQRSLPIILDGVTRRATASLGIMEKLPTPYNIRLNGQSTDCTAECSASSTTTAIAGSTTVTYCPGCCARGTTSARSGRR